MRLLLRRGWSLWLRRVGSLGELGLRRCRRQIDVIKKSIVGRLKREPLENRHGQGVEHFVDLLFEIRVDHWRRLITACGKTLTEQEKMIRKKERARQSTVVMRSHVHLWQESCIGRRSPLGLLFLFGLEEKEKSDQVMCEIMW